MKIGLRLKLACLCLLPSAFGLATFAQGTSFTYQGRLNDGSGPAAGTYDLRFTLYDSTNAPGTVVAGPVTNGATGISNGLFTVTLDFGAGAFNGSARWVEIGVRTNGSGAFTALAPRQPITATPYAIYAAGANAAGLSGTIPAASLGGTYSSAVNFNNGANSFSGTFIGQFLGATFIGGTFAGAFVGDGSGLINLNASQLSTGTVPDARLAGNVARTNQVWLLSGNSDTTAGVHFVGTTDNQPLDLKVNNQRALRLLSTRSNDTVNVLGGSPSNFIHPDVIAATIAGGGTPFFGPARPNLIASDFGTIGGGAGNRIGTNSNSGVIAGGFGHSIGNDSFDATIGGGSFNSIGTNTYYATIAGGTGNAIGNNFADWSMIGGGTGNKILDGSTAGTIAGGSRNTITNSSGSSFIGGGNDNYINRGSPYAVIGGGLGNNVGSNSQLAVIAGGWNNAVESNALYGVIGGGRFNHVNGNHATVAGGVGNYAMRESGTVGGGANNLVNSEYATVPGGTQNWATGTNSFAAGRRAKAMNQGSYVWADLTDADFVSSANNDFSVRASGGVRFVTFGAGMTVDGQPVIGGPIGSGQLSGVYTNAIAFDNGGNSFTGDGSGVSNVNAATLSGQGANNFWQVNGNAASAGQFLGTTNGLALELRASNLRAMRYEPALALGMHVIGGSRSNAIVAVAGGSMFAATISGGGRDILPNLVSDDFATIGGGVANQAGNSNALFDITAPTVGGGERNIASGSHATVPGGFNDLASGNFSFAAGNRAKATNQGAFVWGDSFAADVTSTNSDSVTMRAGGGYRLFSNGAGTAGVFLAAGGGSWVSVSDRNAKENFHTVDSREVLEQVAKMPIQTWNYKSQDPSVRHLGPMAQDFKAAFQLGEYETGIATVDADGVALAAIQGLNRKVEEKEARIRELEKAVHELKTMVRELAGTKADR